MSTKAKPRSSILSQSARKLFLRDTLVFATLTCITLVLYGFTLLLFRSFESHRASLAVYWSDRGQDEMSHGQPNQAATSLRNAISYAPDDRRYELLLAQALSEAGQTDQAINYFLNLWESQPGDGFINLELGRLSSKKGLTQQAINYYRAAIFGDWQGDGPTRRRNVRLELADYLTSIHNLAAARTELLIASGNAENDAMINLSLGGKFAAIGDIPNALNSYKKVLVDKPHDLSALEAAGRLSLQSGDYAAAHGFFVEALEAGIEDANLRGRVLAANEEAERLEDLAFSPNMPDYKRAEHLMMGKAIAEARYNSCTMQLGETAQPPVDMLDLKPRWRAAENIRTRALKEDDGLQESLSSLIRDTEVVASKVCGPPSGDDAILLRLAESREPNQ